MPTLTGRYRRSQKSAGQEWNCGLRLPTADVLPDGVSKCPCCDDDGYSSYPNPDNMDRIGINCEACGGVGYAGIEIGPCASPKGSLHRTLVYRARYIATGVMWCDDDSPDHEVNRLNHEDEPEPWTVPECHEWNEDE